MDDFFKPQVEWNLPLSGAVTKPITVNLGGSANSLMEQQIITRVDSYGRQLGWICDTLKVVVKKLQRAGLSPEDKKALAIFEDMAAAIRLTKA